MTMEKIIDELDKTVRLPGFANLWVMPIRNRIDMLSTGVMVKLGKVYGNLMVDVKASNEKLRERCVRIVRQATGAEDAAARAALIETNYACKPAIVMLLLGVDKTRAETLLTRANGRVAAALEG